MLNLTINHNVHLTRNQRYGLFDGESVETIGIAVPIWINEGKTSEPGREVFCRYILHNTKEETPVKFLENGFEITIPYRPAKDNRQLSDRDWLDLSMKNPDALKNYYAQRVMEVSARNLLDMPDGGSQCLIYREHDKIQKNDMNVVHYVKIEDMDVLLKSLY